MTHVSVSRPKRLLCVLPLIASVILTSQVTAGEPERLAFRVGKVVTMDAKDRVLNNAVVLIAGGKIKRIGLAAKVKIPDGYRVIEKPDHWLLPGLVDAHNHAAGAMHGALYFLALDNAAFFAVNSLVEDVFVLTTSFTTYITRPVSEGVVTALGRVVNQNRTQYIAESVLYDSDDREIARASGIFVRSKVPLSEKIGYQ